MEDLWRGDVKPIALPGGATSDLTDCRASCWRHFCVGQSSLLIGRDEAATFVFRVPYRAINRRSPRITGVSVRVPAMSGSANPVVNFNDETPSAVWT